MTEFQPTYAQSYALVMGVNDYQDLAPLSAAVRGAQDLAGVLEDRYGFDVTLLTDESVSRDSIFGWITHIRRASTPDDRVLIYYAGHGLTRDFGAYNRGYLALPTTRADEWHTALQMDDVAEEARVIPAKHLLYLLDCCFGGLAFDHRGADDPSQGLDYFLTRKARYAISAGGKEFVDDDLAPDGQHSLFSYHLLSWLTNEAVIPAGGVWRARELGNYLETMVARDRRSGHLPRHGHLGGSEGGDFLFQWQTGPQLPYDLEVALRSENGYIRWGAVAALIEHARGSDDDMAAVARVWLAEMAANDPDERVTGAAQSFFDEEQAIRQAEQDRLRQDELDARLADAQARQQAAERALAAAREAERDAEAERQRLADDEQSRAAAMQDIRRRRQITPGHRQPTAVPDEKIDSPPEMDDTSRLPLLVGLGLGLVACVIAAVVIINGLGKAAGLSTMEEATRNAIATDNSAVIADMETQTAEAEEATAQAGATASAIAAIPTDTPTPTETPTETLVPTPEVVHVLFDDSHTNLATFSPSNGPRDFVEFLESEGMIVSYGSDNASSLPDAYTSFEVIIITAYADVEYTETEANLLYEYVDAGGGLFIMSDYTGYSKHPLIRPITDRFGVEIGLESISDSITDFIPHPITSGIESLSLISGGSLGVSDSEQVVAFGDSGRSAVIATNVGAGRLVVIGDFNVMLTELSSSDNKAFGLNIIRWLAHVDG